MRSAVGIGEARRERDRTSLRGRRAVVAGTLPCDAFGQTELRLARADQLDIDLGQDFGVEQRAVLGAA